MTDISTSAALNPLALFGLDGQVAIVTGASSAGEEAALMFVMASPPWFAPSLTETRVLAGFLGAKSNSFESRRELGSIKGKASGMSTRLDRLI